MRKVISLGKVDYNRSGRRNCEAEIEIELDNGRLSICAGIWNPRHSDYYTCGQCVDTVAAFFPKNKKVQEIVQVWDRWHLNDMRAGTPAQMAVIRQHELEFPGYPTSHYDWACQLLEANGLLVDNGYAYGSAWLKEELPADILAKVESW